MRIGIRSQLLLPVLTLLLGVVGMSAWTAYASAHRARLAIEKQMSDIVATAHKAKFPFTEKVQRDMKGISGADYLLKDGSRISTTLPTADVDLPPPGDEYAGQPLTLGSHVVVAGTPYLCSGVRLGPGSQHPGAALYIFYPESLWEDALWEAVRPSLILGAFGGLASLILTVAIGQGLSRRVRELERRTRLIAGGDFSPMPLPRRDDELRDLTRSVNDMAGRLAQLQETVKQTERLRLLGQVSGGLAHQLRNGVTGARLAVELHTHEHPACAQEEPLTVALRQLALVEMHLKRFLGLGGPGSLRREPCSLTGILGEAVALLRPQCKHAHIELVWEPPAADVTVCGDGGQLSQVFVVLLTNAIEAAGPGGRVEVETATVEPERVCVDVWDTGPGPAADVAARLFEPFVTGKRDGVGLGLAVARQVAEAHGGGISWRREGTRTCFRTELPCANPVAVVGGKGTGS